MPFVTVLHELAPQPRGQPHAAARSLRQSVDALPPALSSDATTLGELALHLESTTGIAAADQKWTISVQRKQVATQPTADGNPPRALRARPRRTMVNYINISAIHTVYLTQSIN